MSVSITCNSCSQDISQDEDIFCGDCLEQKDERIAELIGRLETRGQDIKDLEDENERLSGIIDKLNEGLEGVDGE